MARLRRIPQRSCVACGRSRPKRELIRVVRTPSGEVRVDVTGKVAGRGAYVCPEAPCIEQGVRGGRLQRALEVPVPEALIEDLSRVMPLVAAGRRPDA
jgi:predicted RNA-binding protein YlxR (DUF448 family)